MVALNEYSTNTDRRLNFDNNSLGSEVTIERRPTKAAGTKASSLDAYTPVAKSVDKETSPSKSDVDFGTEDGFIVQYTDINNNKKLWKFVLLPAIETTLSFGSSSSVVRGGGQTVPDVKPGVLTQTVMGQKNFMIPGAVPVVQTIGIKSQTKQLVGAFVGTENSGTNGLSALYLGSGDDPRTLDTEGSVSAGQKAEEFDKVVVQQGAPVTIRLKSGTSLGRSSRVVTLRGVIQDFKTYDVRHNRTYYSMNVLYTEYESGKQVTAPSKISSGTLEQSKQSEDYKKLRSPSDLTQAGIIGVKAAKKSINGEYESPNGTTFSYNKKTKQWDIKGTLRDDIENQGPRTQKQITNDIDLEVRK